MSDAKSWAHPFFSANPDIEVLEAFLIDVNGSLRGKWVPLESADKVLKGEFRMPRSSYAVDVWGNDVMAVGLALEAGDSDGICFPVHRSLAPVPWLNRPTAQLLMSMNNPDGSAFYGDPRNVLSQVIARYQARGWTPVVASELEFYLIDPTAEDGKPRPPLSPVTGRRVSATQVYSVLEMQEFETILAELAATCQAQGIPADTTISENGPGQYEINLNHVDDALAAADHAVFMKRAVRGIARRHGLEATFMAKPYGDCSGNGLHVHFSVIDQDGNNIFAGSDAQGTPALRHAIAGLLGAMPDCMALFAPNANSYRRFQLESHAPTTASWGYDNRSSALRVPDSSLAATRIEHRVAGADALPHLVIATILAGALEGLIKQTEPDPPVDGNAYASGAETLPTTWEAALAAFEDSDFIAEQLGADYRHLFTACKRQEKARIDSLVSDVEYDAYLRNI
ncbi:MAG: glutamine synthetase family protein [Pseudomonadota bacterium]